MDGLDLRGELERLHAASFGWALWCCGRRRDEAEEVLQAAYLKILAGRARFGGNSSFRTWLFGVIRHTSAEHRRQAWLRAASSMRWLAHRTSQETRTDLEVLAANSENNRRLRLALAQLPSRQRDVLHLVFYQEMTVEESADVLGVSVGTARTHFARGKARLREILLAGEEQTDTPAELNERTSHGAQ
jgi:RNA polymerase sigma-70 factor (ECF subfamily)